MSSPTRWTAPAALHPIPNQPEHWTKDRDQLIKDCVDWRKRGSELSYMLSPKKDKSLQREAERMHYLFKADELALGISRACGESYAIRMAESVRDCLALTAAEKAQFLGFWHMSVWPASPISRQLAETRLVMSFCLLMKDLCQPYELHMELGMRIAVDLVERINQSPDVQAHDRLIDYTRTPEQYPIDTLARLTAASFRLQVYKCETTWPPPGPPDNPARRSIRPTYIKACVIRQLSVNLNLPSLEKMCNERKQAIRVARPVFDAGSAEVDANALLNRFEMEFKTEDFFPGSPGRESFSWGDATQLGRKWGYCSIAGEHQTPAQAWEAICSLPEPFPRVPQMQGGDV